MKMIFQFIEQLLLEKKNIFKNCLPLRFEQKKKEEKEKEKKDIIVNIASVQPNYKT